MPEKGRPGAGAPDDDFLNDERADGIAILVNREAITRRQLEKAFVSAFLLTGGRAVDPKALWNRVVEETIDEELLDQKADVLHRFIGDEAANRYVRKRRQDAIRLNGGLARLKKALNESGITLDEWEAITQRSFFVKFWIAWKAGDQTVGPDEIKDYFEAHRSDFITPDRYRIAKIEISSGALIPGQPDDGDPAHYFTPEQAKSFMEKLRARLVAIQRSGKDNAVEFEEIAKKFSTGADAAVGGVMISPLNRDIWDIAELSEPDRTALASLSRTGELSDIYVSAVDAQSGRKTYAVLKLLAHVAGHPMDFNLAVGQIAATLQEKKYEAVRKRLFKSLRKKSTIIRVYTDFPKRLADRIQRRRR